MRQEAAQAVTGKKSGQLSGGKDPKTGNSEASSLAQIENDFRKAKEEYVPIDFNAYTIEDASNSMPSIEDAAKDRLAAPVKDSEKLWRISSLTASVDDETRILIVPVPESKRAVKVVDTRYEVQTYGDLVAVIQQVRKSLTATNRGGEAKRYEEKSEEEMQEEMNRKRK